ncbi:hypothetical protein [Alicyclobacillus vulcanalis]|uniref:hypothetical protein n=1 Tax=Alicyclobacillus vulcanalis TaxID=252246 RepID=UPI0009713F54|nr:hypothetical protein [Alicyclobacillus vulcanalis]
MRRLTPLEENTLTNDVNTRVTQVNTAVTILNTAIMLISLGLSIYALKTARHGRRDVASDASSVISSEGRSRGFARAGSSTMSRRSRIRKRRTRI